MQVCTEVVKQVEQAFEDTVEKWVEEVDSVCDDLPWPLDQFCHFVTKMVKVVETVVKTIVVTVITVVCVPVSTAVTRITNLIQWLGSIPILGAIVRWIVGAATFIWWESLGIADIVARLVGITITKHLRLHIIILMRDDGTFTVPPDRVALTVARMEETYRAQANVKVHTDIHEVGSPSPTTALYMDTDAGVFGEDMTGAGMYFQQTISSILSDQSSWFVLHLGPPVVAFVVEAIGDPGRQFGCSAGPLTDYVCVEGGHMMVPPQNDPVTPPITPEPSGATTAMANNTLAHEIGHSCGLWHVDDLSNLLYPNSQGPDGTTQRGDHLSPLQVSIVRSSPHVTYA